ncbi:MAG: hypothetical protein SOR72_05815 [Hornefia sp.]|nr:hypothetical protein [Hornefia sp.]
MTIEQIVDQVYNQVKIMLETASDSSFPKALMMTRSKAESEATSNIEAELSQVCTFINSSDLNNNCDLTDYEFIVIKNLDNDYLAKLSGGIFETPYLRLINKAIMLGKKVFLPQEGIEFLKYEKTAPVAFMQNFNGKLNELKRWKIIVKPEAELIGELRKQYAKIGKNYGNAANTLDKRVITSKDISSLWNLGCREMSISEKSIVTDVAMELIEKNKIKINKF